MSSLPESSSNTARPDFIIRAKSGSITETLSNFVTSPFRRRQASSTSPAPGRRLTKVISKITLKDIQGAKPCGAGGFGTVSMLELPTEGKIALKQLRKPGVESGGNLSRRTVREGETWQDLKHPWVLPFFGILETSTDLYLISPYVENGSLNDYLRKYPDADRGKFLWQVAGAIAYLHECGIVHGDIKASNILVSDGIHALLCDFGLARFETNTTSKSLEGIGTIRFQSPELLREGGGKTFASDAWAFGMTIYEVLSGNVPFHNYPTSRMIDAVANKGEHPPKYPSHSPLGLSYDLLWNIAESCWEVDPAARLAMEEAHKRIRPDQLVLRGHTYYAMSVAFSSDSRTVVSGSYDNTVRLWDVESASQRGGPLRGHTDRVMSVAFSPDCRTVVSGSRDNTVRVWDVDSASQRAVLKGHTDCVTFVAFSADSKTVLSGSRDHTVRLWDVDLGSQRIEGLKGHVDSVWSGAFSPDGKTVVSGSGDDTVRLWDVESAVQPGWTLKGHTDWVWSVTFSPDGKTVASGSDDNTIRLWDMESRGQRSRELKGHTGNVRSVAFSPDGKTVVSGSDDHTVRLWDVESASQQGEVLIGHAGYVRSVAFSPDGRTVVSGSHDHTVRLWDVASTSQRSGTLKGHTAYVRSVAFSPDGKTVVSVSDDYTVRLWDIGSSTTSL